MKGISVLLVVGTATGFLCWQTPLPSEEAADKEIIAVLLGKELTANDKDGLDGLILGTLMEQFAKDNQIESTEEELDAFVLWMEELEKQSNVNMEERRLKLLQELKDLSLSDQEREQKVSRLQMVESILKSAQEKGMDEHAHSGEKDHPFRRKRITCSEGKRSVVPGQSDRLEFVGAKRRG